MFDEVWERIFQFEMRLAWRNLIGPFQHSAFQIGNIKYVQSKTWFQFVAMFMDRLL
jgi:hypothetical protein